VFGKHDVLDAAFGGHSCPKTMLLQAEFSTAEHAAVGGRVGVAVGCAVGDVDGSCVGLELGETDGRTDGCAVG